MLAFSEDLLCCTDENSMEAQRLFRKWSSLYMYKKEPACGRGSLTFFLDLSSLLALARALSSKALSTPPLISQARAFSLAHPHPKKTQKTRALSLSLSQTDSQRLSVLWHWHVQLIVSVFDLLNSRVSENIQIELEGEIMTLAKKCKIASEKTAATRVGKKLETESERTRGKWS